MNTLKKKKYNIFKSIKKKTIFLKKINYYTINDRIVFINNIKNGLVKISNLDLDFPLINIKHKKNSLTYLKNKKMYPNDILTFFSTNSNYKCEYLKECLGKTGIPFKLTIKNLNQSIFLKLSYITKRNIDSYLNKNGCINYNCLDLVNIKKQFDKMTIYQLKILRDSDLNYKEKKIKKERLIHICNKLNTLIKNKEEKEEEESEEIKEKSEEERKGKGLKEEKKEESEEERKGIKEERKGIKEEKKEESKEERKEIKEEKKADIKEEKKADIKEERKVIKEEEEESKEIKEEKEEEKEEEIKKNIILANYTENKLIFLFEELVINRNTPHLVMPIIAFNTLFKNLNIKDLSLFNNDNKNINFDKNLFFENITVYLTEWSNNDTLYTFLKKNKIRFIKNKYLWDVLFFQLLYTLTVIQLKYPSFRHNDLHLNNILVSEYYNYGVNVYKIKLQNKIYEYHIPNVGFQIRLWDFDWASLEPSIINIKTLHEKKNIKNRTYDLFFLLSKIEYNYKILMNDNYKLEHLLFFDDYKKEINSKDIKINKNNNSKVLISNKEYEIPETILVNHSSNSKYSLFYKYLNNDYLHNNSNNNEDTNNSNNSNNSNDSNNTNNSNDANNINSIYSKKKNKTNNKKAYKIIEKFIFI